MERVFVSSVMRDFGAERGAVRDALESLGIRPVMAETAPASPDASKHALLSLVEQADALVLILGARYGYVAESGRSPTEDEFRHAVELGRPVFVFVQEDAAREPEQDAFVARVGGTWESGVFTGFFRTPAELSLSVVKALTAYQDQLRGSDALPEAQDRAERLASDRQHPHNPGSNMLRVVVVPVGTVNLIDAMVLEAGTVGEAAAALVRQHGLVPQAAGIDVQASTAGVILTAKAPADFEPTTISFVSDGAVIADVSVRADGMMGGMAVSYPKVTAAVAATCRLAQDLWGLLPTGDLIRQAALTLGVPEANHHPLTLSGNVGSSMGMPTVTEPLVAPRPAIIGRRAEIGTEEMNSRLAVSLKQAFADHKAIIE